MIKYILKLSCNPIKIQVLVALYNNPITRIKRKLVVRMKHLDPRLQNQNFGSNLRSIKGIV
jgi:hypothetical protein